MPRSRIARILLSFLLVAGISGAARAAEVVVFAAASLTDALEEIGRAYERATGDRVVFNFGASSLLARQIENGASADLFLSADEAKMHRLEARGLLLPGTRRSVLSNALVVVVPRESAIRISSAADLAGPTVRTIVVAEPSSVPAGIYAKEWLSAAGIWSKVADRIVPTENVRGALSAIEAGNADAGIVYRTDAAIGRGVRVAYEVPDGEGPAISYPFAVLRDAPSGEAARKFLDYLVSEAGRGTFGKFRFVTKP